MGLWNYRGVLETEWQDRKEKTGLTTDEIVKLGIQTAEKESKKTEAKKRG